MGRTIYAIAFAVALKRANHPEYVKIFIDHTPLGRSGTPEDIVGPAIFLASDLSAYVTGTIVMADRGYRTV
jgi:3-oxoacyl-[acyl-carrier protein] reductase